MRINKRHLVGGTTADDNTLDALSPGGMEINKKNIDRAQGRFNLAYFMENAKDSTWRAEVLQLEQTFYWWNTCFMKLYSYQDTKLAYDMIIVPEEKFDSYYLSNYAYITESWHSNDETYEIKYVVASKLVQHRAEGMMMAITEPCMCRYIHKGIKLPPDFLSRPDGMWRINSWKDLRKFASEWNWEEDWKRIQEYLKRDRL